MQNRQAHAFSATRGAAFLCWLTACAAALPALALDNPQAVGQWDLTLDGSSKTCRLTLRGEQVHGGNYVGIPAGCRRALPALANVIAWTLAAGGEIDLADVYGAPLLSFFPKDGGALAATGPQGETYKLTFAASAPQPAHAPAQSAGAAEPAAAAAKTATRLSLRPADVAGRYAVLREAGRDTGCMVTLDQSSKAYLAPACRDQGIVTFDPVGWRLAGSRLVLTARKGHTTQLDLQPDGTWLKDATLGNGKSLGLKKL